MRRLLLTAALSLSALACKFEAPGRCSTSTDCTGGLTCLDGVCGPCAGNADCDGWESCSAAKACEVLPDRCNVVTDCSSWEACDGTHTCVLAPNRCVAVADCDPWESCSGTKWCEPLPGRCSTSADCADWEECDAGNTCVMLPDHCPDNLTCAEWETCDAVHHCSLAPGRCYTDANCGAWASCVTADHQCEIDTTDGNDVMIWGTLSEGACWLDAIARVKTPNRVTIGTDCDTSPYYQSVTLSPNGDMLFVAGTRGGAVVALRADHMDWDPDFTSSYGIWVYPVDPEANDPIRLPRTLCPTGYSFNVQAGTGALMYGCANGMGAMDYYDSSDSPVPGLTGLYSVYSWNANDVKLVSATLGLFVIDAAGVKTAVSGFSGTIQAVRAQPDGFWVVVIRSSVPTNTWELWKITDAGLASKVGTYNLSMPGYYVYGGDVIDSDGRLYVRSRLIDSMDDSILQVSLAPATPVVIYTEANRPVNANDWDSYTFNPYVMLHGSTMFTSP